MSKMSNETRDDRAQVIRDRYYAGKITKANATRCLAALAGEYTTRPMSMKPVMRSMHNYAVAKSYLLPDV